MKHKKFMLSSIVQATQHSAVFLDGVQEDLISVMFGSLAMQLKDI